MHFPAKIHSFDIGGVVYQIRIPDSGAIAAHYAQRRQDAYWARVWPASLALCLFLQAHPEYITDKKVLELGAGLGLPGLSIAGVAREVMLTDIEPLAIEYINQSASGLKNVRTKTLNWRDALKEPSPEVLLLSDVNYAPGAFEDLEAVIEEFLSRGTTVILSTPQRLVARSFLLRLSAYTIAQTSYTISPEAQPTEITVFLCRHPDFISSDAGPVLGPRQ